MHVDKLCFCGSLVIEVYENIGILKIEFFNFSGTERVKRSCQKGKFQKKDEHQSKDNIPLLS